MGCTALHFVCVKVAACGSVLSCWSFLGSWQGWCESQTCACMPAGGCFGVQEVLLRVCLLSVLPEKVSPWCGDTCPSQACSFICAPAFCGVGTIAGSVLFRRMHAVAASICAVCSVPAGRTAAVLVPCAHAESKGNIGSQQGCFELNMEGITCGMLPPMPFSGVHSP